MSEMEKIIELTQAKAAAYDAGERMYRCSDVEVLNDTVYCVHDEESDDCGWVRIVREVDDE